MVRPDKGLVEPNYAADSVTYGELEKLKPDVVFIEGGAFDLGGKWRIAEEIIEKGFAAALPYSCPT